jgi:hypothetical protein
MPTASSQDATTVEAAYQDCVKTLFSGLCTNLEQGENEQHGVQQFTKGYNLAKRAKELALSVVGATSAQAIAMRTTHPRGRSATTATTKRRDNPR